MTWKIWDNWPGYGNILFKRATGELEEMKCAISVCRHVSDRYKPGMRLLDVGCGAGHYLRSLRQRVDPFMDYTGVDATSSYLDLAKKAFPDVHFLSGDIHNLPVESNAFDIVMCNNLLLHLPPPPTRVLSELLRVSRKHIIIRTVLGERNYVIKELRSSGELGETTGFNQEVSEDDVFDQEGEAARYNYFNMYTEQYLRKELLKIASDASVVIVEDSGNNFDNRKVGGKTATYISGGRQISGNLILDWRFILIEK